MPAALRPEDFDLTADRDVEPLFTAPPQSCDAHFHVFGPADRYPHGGVDEKLRYAPPLAPLEDYLAQARRLGFERFVFVQPSAYGRDNAYMLDAMAPRCRETAASSMSIRTRPMRAGRARCRRRPRGADQCLAGEAAGSRLRRKPAAAHRRGSMHVAPKSAGTWISCCPDG